MPLRRVFTLIVICLLPAASPAELANGDLPVARWYAHVDLVAMRRGDAGKHLYSWLEREVFDELREEIGFDATAEVDAVTALASPDGGIMIVVDGNFSQTTRDRIVALGALSGDFRAFEFDGSPYYFIGDNEPADNRLPQRNDSLEDGAYVSLALKNKLLVAQSEQQLQQLIKGKGRIPGDYDSTGSLLVLRAQQNLMQAGADARGFGEDLGWDSNVLRNTTQVALLAADVAGKIALEARLVATEANVANSLASIVRGLISLQVFNDDLDPALTSLLQGARVDVDGTSLTVKLSIDPATVIGIID